MGQGVLIVPSLPLSTSHSKVVTLKTLAPLNIQLWQGWAGDIRHCHTLTPAVTIIIPLATCKPYCKSLGTLQGPNSIY